MAFEVNYVEGFEEWWNELTVEQQEDVAARVELLEQHGPALGRPVVDRVVSSRYAHMKELRCSSDGVLRVLFAFDPRRRAVLLIGGDKSGTWNDWYKTAVPEADRRYENYLHELETEGDIE